MLACWLASNAPATTTPLPSRSRPSPWPWLVKIGSAPPKPAPHRAAKLSGVEILILDEGDRMFDMGFLPDVKRILKLLPAQRQSMLFSATFPKEVEELARQVLH